MSGTGAETGAAVLVAGISALDVILALPELPGAAAKYRADQGALAPGGCAANAAIAVARLGGRAWLASRLGDDLVGDLVVKALAEEGVETALVHRQPGARSSFSSVLVDAAGERQIVNFRGTGLDACAGWSGHVPAVRAVLADTRWTEGAAEALRLAQARGIAGVLDAEPPIAPELLDLASHVAFSRAGLAALSARSDPAEALAEAMAGRAAWACVTDGAAGVYVLSGGEVEHLPAFAVEARDTLGAGDVWHGAFVLRLAEGAGEREAVRFANAAAALKCTRFGGGLGAPGRSETEEFLRERGQWN
ncbi:sulfofructose kinase [Meinhardsimonia xiamenensis]|jgi:sulfofructose kinase|uniref:Sulfofructose kinase n=1 Tax=Meinhardsimonia xiamenensis TaxID=990712 RepID=A0A1G9D1Y9_9RHOB|nr:PfkB family carbohydrate kinase [Meinhardsimonia xiamenensis]PRX38160.1 sulfofructose kinase [Meinhardsimonia xiamenensis]SDK57907.1 sulfofructose kinase [Meinhardsimonia xiamenensis]